MIAALAACGGGDPEADAREQLSKMGFSDKLTDCVLDELKDKAGSIDKFTDLSASEQQSMATDAGAACASEADPDEIGERRWPTASSMPPSTRGLRSTT